MLRRILAACLLLLVLPSVLAAGFGLWTRAGAWQQHLALDLLLRLLLWMEGFGPRTSLIREGLVGTWELPLLLGAAALLVGTARFWEHAVPRQLLPLLDLPEMALAALGLVAGGAILAIGASVDRALFWTGPAMALLLGQALAPRPPPAHDEGGWRAPGNRGRRLAVALLAVAASFYGVTSLWEGATWRNPVFRLAGPWLAGPGRSAWLSGGAWLAIGLLVGGGALAFSCRGGADRQPGAGWRVRVAIGLLAGIATIEVLAAPAPGRGVAASTSALGLLALCAGAGPLLRRRLLPRRHPAALLDPRHLAALLLPWFLWGGLCMLRGFTVTMWTPAAFPGVERLSDADCVFSLSLDQQSGDLWYTDRCRTRLGRVAATGGEDTWDLAALGADHVEELGGPDAQGVLWAASQAYVPEANLVLQAIEGVLGPRSLPRDPPLPKSPADEARAQSAPYVPMPSCWVSSWIPVPAGDHVLLGCENRGGVEVLDPASRRIAGEVALSASVETGAFGPSGDRLYGVSLWADPRVRSWSWPDGREVARAVIGPFNWTVVVVPEPRSLWVSRFVEGSVLVLDPDSLDVTGRVPLSFGIRAMLHEPVHDLVWAAAAYSGRLWIVEPRAPFRRMAVPICGQARDLASDSLGRVVVSTDCGIFRIDPVVASRAGSQP